MSELVSCGLSRSTGRAVKYLATRMATAGTHWTRLRGLLRQTPRDNFVQGRGLWIVPCRGVHTLGMRFPIDVVYLTKDNVVLHLEHGLRPWRFAPIRMRAASVLELPENTVRSTGTTIGDELEIDPHHPEKPRPA